MDVGVPREVRSGERRVALTPSGVKALVHRGHRVWVETGAGAHAGHPDGDYEAAGATIAYSRREVWTRAGLVAAIYPPEPDEVSGLPPDSVILAIWMLPAASPAEVEALRERAVTAIGLEAIRDAAGHAPVVTAMSEIAGPIAVAIGAGLLLNAFGGKGILLGGAPGVPPAHFVVFGAGTLGRGAARAAAGLGADVMLLDKDVDVLRSAVNELGPRVTTLVATRPNVEKALSFADLLLGAVGIPGKRAPILVTRDMLRLMRPRTVVMDLSVDTGGCFETTRPTRFPDAVYEVDGILHFCVPNLPSTAARSATLALTNVTLPWLEAIAEMGIERALEARPELRRGLLLDRGRLVEDPGPWTR